MKKWYILLSSVALFGACTTVKTATPAAAGATKPVDAQLYRTIAQ